MTLSPSVADTLPESAMTPEHLEAAHQSAVRYALEVQEAEARGVVNPWQLTAMRAHLSLESRLRARLEVRHAAQ